jgi:phosphoglycerate dehydrogenase-like enzyme
MESALAEADLIILQDAALDAGRLRSAARCRAVIHAGSGCATELETARELGIFVCSISDAATGAYRSAAGLFLREFLANAQSARESTGSPLLRRRPRVGLVGFGRLGRAIADEARGLKMDVWAFDPFALDEHFQCLEIHRSPTLHDLLGLCDLALVQVAEAESNRGLIGEDQIGWMRRGAWLANLGWGPALDAAALPAALRSGRLGRALIATPSGELDSGGIPTHHNPNPGGGEIFDPLAGREAEVRGEEIRRALDLAERFARGEEPSPLLIDPPLPRWGD